MEWFTQGLLDWLYPVLLQRGTCSVHAGVFSGTCPAAQCGGGIQAQPAPFSQLEPLFCWQRDADGAAEEAGKEWPLCITLMLKEIHSFLDDPYSISDYMNRWNPQNFWVGWLGGNSLFEMEGWKHCLVGSNIFRLICRWFFEWFFGVTLERANGGGVSLTPHQPASLWLWL